MDPLTGALIIVACLLASAFFSGSETALLRMRSHELDADIREARGPSAFAIRDLLRSTSRLLVTILLANSAVNILGPSVATALAVHWLGDQYGIVASTAGMTLLILVFGEVLPKALAAAHPRRISHAVALPLYLFHKALWPVHVIFDGIVDPFVRRVAGAAEEGPPMATVEDVLRLAREASAAQPDTHPDAHPLEIIGSAAGAANMTVMEIMVPRAEIVAFPKEIRPTELIEKVLEERYTRVLIYEGSIDRILGIVHLKDLVQLLSSNGTDLAAILKPILRVPGRKPILRLLADMQRGFVHVAVVKDEFGVTLGMVTQEDILEEIVGEIRDEFDREELLTIRELPEGGYEALGRVKVVDFNRETGWEVPAERGDTLAGLVFHELGRAPRKGDVVRVPGYEFSIADVSGTRITQVLVREQGDERRARPASEG
ncbi:MAG: HlyC/CorC family transporter [Deltaproteobacteria bacterium]|nr:HlyC/CorC family transporter [Deltaproteobacteria bacterium]